MQAHYTIRHARPDDAAGVTQLLQVSYAYLMATHYTPQVLERALPLITRANPDLLGSGSYYVAEDGSGAVVGCGGWSAAAPGRGTGDAPPGTGHVRHFATHPDWTGRGIGRGLHERGAAEAGAAGVSRFECFASLNAEAFYAALGFRRVRPLEVALSDGVAFPAVLMECPLARR